MDLKLLGLKGTLSNPGRLGCDSKKSTWSTRIFPRRNGALEGHRYHIALAEGGDGEITSTIFTVQGEWREGDSS